MTRKQIGICKKVVRYRNLSKVLRKTGISDYFEIQAELGEGVLLFSDTDMDEHTSVSLSNEAMEELEHYRSKVIDTWFTRGIAIAALVISVIALLGQLGILRLQ